MYASCYKTMHGVYQLDAIIHLPGIQLPLDHSNILPRLHGLDLLQTPFSVMS